MMPPMTSMSDSESDVDLPMSTQRIDLPEQGVSVVVSKPHHGRLCVTLTGDSELIVKSFFRLKATGVVDTPAASVDTVVRLARRAIAEAGESKSRPSSDDGRPTWPQPLPKEP